VRSVARSGQKASDCRKGGWTTFDGKYTFRRQRECLKQVPRENARSSA